MSKHKIPTPRMPTDEEIRVATLPRWRAIEPLLLANLADEILELSMPTIMIPVPASEIREGWFPGFDGKPTPGADETLREAAILALDAFPGGFFFKFDSRSPKDVGILRHTQLNVGELRDSIFGSERMLDDFAWESRHREHFTMCFREWVAIEAEQRAFVKDGNLLGVSRYAYHDVPSELPRDDWVMDLAGWYLARIAPRLGISTFVFDFGYTPDGEPVLIELNPYGLSDPCCFGSYDRIAGYAREILE